MANAVPNEVVSQIQNEVNIVDIVSQYVQLKKRGKNYFGFCPFHDEKTPSFSVAEEKQLYYCFSCGRGGSVFSFISEVENISFPEAVEKVVDIAHLPYELNISQGNTNNTKHLEYQGLYQAHKEAQALYEHILQHTNGGDKALRYLIDRGYTEETIKLFGLGYSPKNREILVNQVKGLNISEEDMIESGLFVHREETNEFLDRFSRRIMIPLRDASGQVIGFSGRVLVDETNEIEQSFSEDVQAKYLNSPETKLFNKRNFLFNFDQARSHIRKNGLAVLFEGYMDVIASWQAGVKEGIASMGTSLTQEQINILNRVTDKVLIAYDGDEPGLHATNRAIELIQQYSNMQVLVLPLEEGLDPDEYIQKYGNDAYKDKLYNHSETVFQFRRRYYRSQYNLTVEKDKVTYIELLIQEIGRITSPIEQDLMMSELEREFSLSKAVITERLAHYQKQQERQMAKTSVVEQPVISMVNKPKSMLEIPQKQLLYRLIHSPESWNYLFIYDDEFSFHDAEFQELYYLLQELRMHNDHEVELGLFMAMLVDEQLQSIVASLEWLDMPEDCTSKEIEELAYYISTREKLLRRSQQVKIDLQVALTQGDTTLAQELMLEQIAIQKQLKMRIKTPTQG
ncbi:DNA primase [Granulicatella balaenopterae]|uniref:DNA primase n=1 Tax=Granulicatella balaenopterae TaxID=137733 RepID=A0A1H9LMG2_9LACT|nr:DNA primase [Granulicatella balaenopterae]SER12325.1 DNA primase [Granulicatella balaenopterae]